MKNGPGAGGGGGRWDEAYRLRNAVIGHKLEGAFSAMAVSLSCGKKLYYKLYYNI